MLFASNLQYDTNRSLLRMLESDYKDNLVNAVHAMGYNSPRGSRKAQLAQWLSDHILHQQLEVWRELTADSKRQLQQLLHAEQGQPIGVPYSRKVTQLQMMNLVITYEDTTTRTDYYFLLDEVRNAYMIYRDIPIEKEKPKVSSTENRFDSLIDIVEKYPVKHQALIWILMHNISQGLPSQFPLSDFPPYDDDFHHLLEKVCTNAPVGQWEPITALLATDARTVISTIPDVMKQVEEKKYTFDDIPMGFFFNMIGLMMMTSALQHTLRTLSPMPEKEVDRLLSDREQQGSIIYFNSVEKLADKIISKIMKDIDPANVVKRPS